MRVFEACHVFPAQEDVVFVFVFFSSVCVVIFDGKGFCAVALPGTYPPVLHAKVTYVHIISLGWISGPIFTKKQEGHTTTKTKTRKIGDASEKIRRCFFGRRWHSPPVAENKIWSEKIVRGGCVVFCVSCGMKC